MSRFTRLLWLACLWTGAASANGRYPRAQQLLEEPGNPQRLWLRTTYGLLTTADRGKSWGYICESAIGYSGELDPGIGVASGGRVLVGLPDGVVSSTDGGCSFDEAPELAGRDVADISVERADPTRVVALESTHEGGGVFTTLVHLSVDGGETWQPHGTALPDTVLGLTLDVAPSDPQRIYLSGLVNDVPDAGVFGTVGTVFASADAGQSWTRHDVPGSVYQAPPYIAAIHPSDPDTFYVRVYGYADPELPDFPEDSLFVTSDGGETFVEILKQPSRLLGFALSPDGGSVFAGYGNPYDTFQAESETFGLYEADAPGFAFERLSEGHIGCLTWGANGFYECTEQAQKGFELGVATNPSQPFEPLLTTSQIAPLVCPASTPVADQCGEAWSFLCVRLGLCTVDAGVDGGAVTTDASTEPAQPSGGGCDCGIAHTEERPGKVLLGLALLLASRRVSRRRRSPEAASWRPIWWRTGRAQRAKRGTTDEGGQQVLHVGPSESCTSKT